MRWTKLFTLCANKTVWNGPDEISSATINMRVSSRPGAFEESARRKYNDFVRWFRVVSTHHPLCGVIIYQKWNIYKHKLISRCGQCVGTVDCRHCEWSVLYVHFGNRASECVCCGMKMINSFLFWRAFIFHLIARRRTDTALPLSLLLSHSEFLKYFVWFMPPIQQHTEIAYQNLEQVIASSDVSRNRTEFTRRFEFHSIFPLTARF